MKIRYAAIFLALPLLCTTAQANSFLHYAGEFNFRTGEKQNNVTIAGLSAITFDAQKNISDEQIKAATKAVDLDHFIETLPNGYDTVLDDSVSLSAGQQQLLTIARALISNAPMLILDEATSSVDTRTELHIQHAMERLLQNRTSFVVAHRLSTIQNADKIIVMNHGSIVETGNHDELMAKNGFYADLYNSQFAGNVAL